MDCSKKEDKQWETIVDFTEIREGGIPLEEILMYLQNI